MAGPDDPRLSRGNGGHKAGKRGRPPAWVPLPSPWLIFAGTLIVYLLTASYTFRSFDPEAASTPAWVLVNTGTLDVSGYAPALNTLYFETSEGVRSDRFPGTIFYALPLYGLARGFGSEDRWIPGVMSAALVTAVAVTMMSIALRRTPVGAPTALGATLFFAFGTWTVSADSQWSHGANQLLIAGAMVALTRERTGLAGLILGLTVFVRPQMAPAVLVIGLMIAAKDRPFQELVRYGIPATLGTILLLAYHRITLGVWSVGNGQTEYKLATEGPEYLLSLPLNLAGTLLDPTRGVVILYPALLLAAWGLPTAWRSAPTWVRSTALGGSVALLTQLSLNRHTGGDAFFGSRLTIEALTLGYPLLVIAWSRLPVKARRVGATLLAVSVVLHAVGAVSYPYVASGHLSALPVVAAATLTSLLSFTAVAQHISQGQTPLAEQRTERRPPNPDVDVP